MMLANDGRRQAEQRELEAIAARLAETKAKQKAIASEELARESEEDTKAFSSFLVNDILSTARPKGERGGLGMDVTVRRALNEAANQIQTAFLDRPRAEAIAQHDLGVTFRLMGELQKAERHFRRSWELRKVALGEDDAFTLQSMSSLTVVLGAMGRNAEGIAIAEDLLRLQKAKHGATDDDYTYFFQSLLADRYAEAGEVDIAIPIWEEALQNLKRLLPPKSPLLIVLAVGSTTYLYSNGAWLNNGAEIRKYSPTGSLTWSKSLAGGYGMGANRVATDSTSNVYISGGFAGTVDFNPDPKKSNTATGSPVYSSGSGVNAYVLKLTSAGTYSAVAPLVAKTQEVSTAYVNITDLAVDSSDSIVIGGNYRGPADFNPSSSAEYRLPSISTIGDGYVEKLSSNLVFSWSTMMEGGRISALAIDSTGIYTIGTFSSTVSFAGSIFTTNGSNDVAVAKWSSIGTQEWALTFGGTGSETGNGIAVDSAGTLSIVGTYQGTVDFDPDPLTSYTRTNAAWADMYLLKLRRR